MTARAGIHPARNRSARAIIGASTDLGKSILIYGQGLDLYSLHPSEGDHADFPRHHPLGAESDRFHPSPGSMKEGNLL